MAFAKFLITVVVLVLWALTLSEGSGAVQPRAPNFQYFERFGTGYAAPPTRSRLHAAAAPPNTNTKGTSWKDKFNTILDSATDTEGVHLMLNDLMPSGSYYRFNPPLMETYAMDEIDPKKIQNMITDTHAYIRRNQHKFEQVARRLTRPRSLVQRAADRLHRRALVMGLTHTH